MSASSFLRLGIAGGIALLVGGCEFGPKALEQTGYRGTGADQVTAKRRLVAQPVPPPPFELPADGGPTAGATYQNVQVLSGVSAERFNYLMAAMNNWIAPTTGDPNVVGCNYCHNPNNMASDEKYTKIVARRMLQMTLNINSRWTGHVKGTGVTCYTCHRGNVVPRYSWAQALAGSGRLMGNKRGQNTPDPAVAYASLPYDPFSAYLGTPGNIRVQDTHALADRRQGSSIQKTEATYGLMMHMSSSLNVNCTYCHNSQSWQNWSESRPQRVQAWYGIRMVRNVNADYISPLASVFPAYRKGPAGDPYKVNCTTCHQGLNKPLGGVSMLPDYPFLRGNPATGTTLPMAVPAAAPGAAPAPAAAPDAGTKGASGTATDSPHGGQAAGKAAAPAK